ncbi:hypothetical protein AB3K78_11300 [Leucobacter sp. HNU]|uniref:hypothetical protein n=1 Tax=Leucobacter sp. HNU TaxID=3236805 RepID=UPI003A800B68
MARPASQPEPTPVEIEHWEGFGGTWRVESADGTRCRIALCRCDGGEVVEHWESEDPAIVRWATRIVSADDTGS